MPEPEVIDIHIHIQPWWQLKPAIYEKMKTGRENFDELIEIMKDPKKLLKILDAEKIAKVGIINYTSPDLMGLQADCNDFSSQYQSAAPDRIFAYGSVHPRFVDDCDAEIHRLIDDLDIKAIKIHPPHQLFFPNDYLNDPDFRGLATVYKRCEEWGIPVMFHTGTSFFTGARIKYGDPVHIDDVAVDFPNLKIIMAHGGRPIWMETAFYLVRRHKNVYLDISSIPPARLIQDYFPRLEQIADKVLFGTDWPAPMVPSIRKNVNAFIGLGLPEPANRRILSENARKIFGF